MAGGGVSGDRRCALPSQTMKRLALGLALLVVAVGCASEPAPLPATTTTATLPVTVVAAVKGCQREQFMLGSAMTLGASRVDDAIDACEDAVDALAAVGGPLATTLAAVISNRLVEVSGARVRWMGSRDTQALADLDASAATFDAEVTRLLGAP